MSYPFNPCSVSYLGSRSDTLLRPWAWVEDEGMEDLVRLKDLSGRQLFALDLKGLAPGMYRLQVWGKEWLGERTLMLR